MRLSRSSVLASCAALLLSCSDRGCGALKSSPDEGVLLEGNPAAPALAALSDLPVVPSFGAELANGLMLTRIDAAIRPDATIGEVNEALSAIGGGIVGMSAGVPLLVIAVPSQKDAAGLESLTATLLKQPGIRAAFPGRATPTQLAPPGAPANEELALRHLADARFPAAWNVASLAANCPEKTTVLVADYFTRPLPANSAYTRFPTEVSGVDTNGPGGRDTRDTGTFHGYDVLTTLAAGLDANIPTGANPFPACLDIRTVQVPGLTRIGLTLEIGKVLSLVRSAKMAVNTSLGAFSCSEPCLPQALSGPTAAELAFQAATLRQLMAPLAGRFLWSAAAGNEAGSDLATVYGGVGRAEYSSGFAIAAKADPEMLFALDESLWEPVQASCVAPDCFPSLTMPPDEAVAVVDFINDFSPAARTPVADLLLVGSTVPSVNTRSAFSNPGADVSAVGEQIPTLAPSSTQPFGVTQGTSFAAPQVAALASYLWMISPELREVLPASATTSAIMGNVTGVERQVDAYASVLSLDPAGDPNPATWKVRRTLLDVDEDGKFAEADIAAFVARFFTPPALEEWVLPASRDHSRFDLNGDGFTGGPRMAVSFDLDRQGSTQYGAPLLTPVTVQVGSERLNIDEHFVNDLDLLCYYAYSPLYEGSIVERERLLVNKCFNVSVDVSPSGPTVPTGQSVSFAATVRGSSDPRVTWSLPGGGGTIDSKGVFQAGSVAGTFEVRAKSVVAPDQFGTAVVTVTDVVTGVRKVESRGRASVNVTNVPDFNCQFLDSPADATTWSDTATCSSADSFGNSASGSSTTSFTETYVGNRLVEITASGASNGAGVNSGSALAVGSYFLQFEVLEPTQMTIDASVVAPVFGQALVRLIQHLPNQRPVDDTDGGAVNVTLQLAPGYFDLNIIAGPSSNPNVNESASFNLHVKFGP